MFKHLNIKLQPKSLDSKSHNQNAAEGKSN